MPRCPKGTRKNKQGICEPIKEREKKGDKTAEEGETLDSCIQQCVVKHRVPTPVKTPSPVMSKERTPSPSQQKTKKRCPKGLHRNKAGECVPKKSLKKSPKSPNPIKSSISPILSKSPKSSISRLESADTPRKVYVKTYLTHPVKLLGKKKLFQVSFPNPDQFINYKKITGSDQPENECFIQSLFSLGLRDRKEAKKDLGEIKLRTIGGVTFLNAAKYFEKSFGLNHGQIKHSWMKTRFEDNTEFNDHINVKLIRELRNNYATIITIHIKNNTKMDEPGLGHYMVAYKHDNILYYFDPQSKSLTTHPNSILKNKKYSIVNYGFFNTENILESIDLKDSSCLIDYDRG